MQTNLLSFLGVASSGAKKGLEKTPRTQRNAKPGTSPSRSYHTSPKRSPSEDHARSSPRSAQPQDQSSQKADIREGYSPGSNQTQSSQNSYTNPIEVMDDKESSQLALQYKERVITTPVKFVDSIENDNTQKQISNESFVDNNVSTAENDNNSSNIDKFTPKKSPDPNSPEKSSLLLPKFNSFMNSSPTEGKKEYDGTMGRGDQLMNSKVEGFIELDEESVSEVNPYNVKSEDPSSPYSPSGLAVNSSPNRGRYQSTSAGSSPTRDAFDAESSPSTVISDKQRSSLRSKFSMDGQTDLSEIYPFLNPPLDAEKHPPDHPAYDPNTLYIPQRELDKMTPMTRQYWEVKSRFFSYVVFFRKGKFWEMYENDALVVANECDLKLTKSHGLRLAGVPLLSFNKFARMLVSRGYRIVAVDEVGYSDGEKLKTREIQQIITPATVLDTDIVDGGTLDITKGGKPSISSGGPFSQNGVSPNQLLVSMCFNKKDKQTQEIGIAVVNFANLSAKFHCISLDEYSINTFFLSCIPTELIVSGVYGTDLSASYTNAKKTKVVQSRSVSKLVGIDCFKIISSMLNKDAIVYYDPTQCGAEEIKTVRNSLKKEVWEELYKVALQSNTVNETYRRSRNIFETNMSGYEEEKIPLLEDSELINNTVISAFYQMVQYLTKIRINDIICTNMIIESNPGQETRNNTGKYDMIHVPTYQLHPTTVRAINVIQNSELLLRGITSWKQNASGNAGSSQSIATQGLSQDASKRAHPHANCPTLLSRLGKLYLQSSLRHDNFLLSPLTNGADIISRQRVIHYLMTHDKPRSEIQNSMKGIGDLERIGACIRIGCNGGKINEKRIIELIISVEGVLKLNSTIEGIISGDSTVVTDVEANGEVDLSYTSDSHPLAPLMLQTEVKASLKNKLREIKELSIIDYKESTIKIHPEADSETAAIEQDIKNVKDKLEKELQRAREDFGFRSNSMNIEYCSVLKKHYLLKINKAVMKENKVPPGYDIIAETKTDYKCQTARIVKLVTDLEEKKSEMECSRASGVRRVLLNCIADRQEHNGYGSKSALSEVVEEELAVQNRMPFLHATRLAILHLTLIDFMQSLATAALTGIRWVFPEIYDFSEGPEHGSAKVVNGKDYSTPSTSGLESSKQFIFIENGVHPCYESFVPNDIVLGGIPLDLRAKVVEGASVDPDICEDQNLILLTGGNMSGKSTYLKTAASLVLLAQLGAPVPCDRMLFTPVTDIIMRCDTGTDSDLLGGRSTFLIEMQDACEMIQVSRLHNHRPLLLLDELGRGTSTLDGRSLAEATYISFMKSPNALTIASTHSTPTAALLGAMGCGLRMMEALIENPGASSSENEDEDLSAKGLASSLPKIRFTHKIIEGLSPSSFGCSVAFTAGVPTGIVNEAHELTSKEEAKEYFALLSEAEQMLSGGVISQVGAEH